MKRPNRRKILKSSIKIAEGNRREIEFNQRIAELVDIQGTVKSLVWRSYIAT